jgi:hypothetical protein
MLLLLPPLLLLLLMFWCLSCITNPELSCCLLTPVAALPHDHHRHHVKRDHHCMISIAPAM